MTANRCWKYLPVASSLLLLSFAVSLVPITATAHAQTAIYPATTLYPTATNTVAASIATGDFNGDGLPDIAYVSVTTLGVSSPPILTVLLNQGPGNPPKTVATSSLTNCTAGTSLQAADLNNDNKLDAILTCTNGYVAVMLGNGDGSFQNPAYYAVSGPYRIATAVDFNGDGYLDLAVLSTPTSLPSAVAVLLNRGANAPGIFSAAKNYPPPNGLALDSIGVGDFNGDGKQDVIAATGGTTSPPFALFYGNGDGTLQAAQTVPGGGSFFAGDLNHDRITDVAYIAANSVTSTVSVQVLLGSSGGGFATGASLPLSPAFANATPILAGTTNNGSDVNLALVGNYTTILLGDGKGGFTVGQSYALTGYPAASQAAGNGQANLVFNVSSALGLATLTGNADGTFQGIPAASVGQTGLTAADVNGDGIADVLGVDTSGNLLTALGRGNGQFSLIDESRAGQPYAFLATGDFNGDGRVDAAAITAPNEATVSLYLGNGDGTFQPGLPAVDLKTSGAQQAAVGDFNGDSNLDLVVSYSTQTETGLIFLPGKGNGAFGTPVPFSQSATGTGGEILVADLNNDKKLDLVWNDAVYLGNGDGTFRQLPLGMSKAILAVGDLNGDGIPDLVAGDTVYAGNGDGTFQASPFYTAVLPQSAPYAVSASIGDVNADGHPDLLMQYSPGSSTGVAVFLGDGRGNFTVDSNTYYTGNSSSNTNMNGSLGVLTRLSNRAPKLPNDNALDYLVFANGAPTSLLNQLNPTPTAPLPIQSSSALAVSATSANENQQLTFTAGVIGTSPTGSVSFASGSSTLGTAAVVNGTATLSASFATAGNYSVTANYAGDSQNSASISNTVSIAVAAPDFTVTASPASATVTAGQSATTTLTITPVGGYSGTVSFSCGTLPSEATCSFAPASVTLSNGGAVASTLTIATTAPSTAMLRGLPGPLQGIAWAGVVCLLFLPRRAWKINRRLLRSALLMLFLTSGFFSLIGCGSSSSPPNPGTPAGRQTITVSLADSTGKLSHSVSFVVTVQ